MTWISELYSIPNGGALYQSSLIWHWNELDETKPDIVVNLAEMAEDIAIPPRTWRGVYLYHQIDDGPLPEALPTLIGLANFVGDEIRSGKKALVHCSAGINRSSLFSGLILYNLGVAKGDALVQYIRSKRPGALTNTTFANFLSGYPETYQLKLYLRGFNG